MADKLVTLTDDERQAANARYLDPEGWRHAESMANHTLRQTLRNVAHALEIARQYPDDPDAQRLIAAVKAIHEPT